MTIITVTSSGALKLPDDTMAHLGHPKHVSVRFNSTGISLMPVEIQPSMGRKEIPEIKPPVSGKAATQSKG